MESILFLNSRPLRWCGSMENPLLELLVVTQESVDFKRTQSQRWQKNRGGPEQMASLLCRLQSVTVWTPLVETVWSAALGIHDSSSESSLFYHLVMSLKLFASSLTRLDWKPQKDSQEMLVFKIKYSDWSMQSDQIQQVMSVQYHCTRDISEQSKN